MTLNLSIIRFVICFLFLGIAVISDIRTRKVPNDLWMIMAPIAASTLAIDLYLRGVGWRYYLIFVPIGFLFIEALIEMPPLFSNGKINPYILGWFMLPVLVLIYMLYSIESSMLLLSLMSVIVMMVLAFVLYYFAILYGGADAKAVVVLAVLFPFYPEIQGLTHWLGDTATIDFMEIFFPFTFVILLNAALLTLFLSIYYFALNLKNSDIAFPEMFFGYKMKVDKIEDSFVWPMEYYENGKKRIKLFPKGLTEGAVKSLKERGKDKAWVSPKIPFLVSMFFGFLLSYILGNPLLYLFREMF